MASIVMTGGGVVGLTTAMLLADDGHEVTVLERDQEPVPDPADAWESWGRRGVNQFRMAHFFMPRFRIELERALPRVAKALDEVGAIRVNPIALAPAEFTGGWRDGDEDFGALTGRRAVVEATIARQAESTTGVTVRRGTACSGLVSGEPSAKHPEVVNVVGVRTDVGEEIPADLVIDATGRRSPLPEWLKELGAEPIAEELEDSGFVYYGRHFRAPDGSMPPSLGPGLQHYGSLSTLTLPCDNGTWVVTIVTSSRDAVLRGLRDNDRFAAVVRSLPLVAHWMDGEPLEDKVVMMAKIEDRHRSLMVDGQPVATGVVALADAWACTNPSLGRGVTIGSLHGLALRDVLREHDARDGAGVATAFDEATMKEVEPWYRRTLAFDRHRLAEIEAEINGETYESDDPGWEIGHSLEAAAGRDPDCLRAFMSQAFLLRTPEEVFSVPGLLDKVVATGGDWRDAPRLGPTRAELVSIVNA